MKYDKYVIFKNPLEKDPTKLELDAIVFTGKGLTLKQYIKATRTATNRIINKKLKMYNNYYIKVNEYPGYVWKCLSLPIN